MKPRQWLGIALIVGLVLFKLVAYLGGPGVDATPPERLLPPKTEAPTAATPGEVCEATYRRFYASDTIDIRVLFGYKDARPARFVGDRYESLVFIRYLVSPCRPGWNACGFTRDTEDPELFRKSIKGPDGKTKQIRLQVVQSAAGPDDSENRNDGFQKWKTLHASRIFLEGLEKADAVFYNGHSRDGGGPDFGPPKTTSDDHVAYGWYTRTKPGMKKLISTLEGKTQVKLLGLFSCASSGHFMKEIAQTKPELGLITSARLLYYADALQAQLGALSALLGQECESSFGRALKTQPEAGSSRMTGFFKN